MGVSSAAAAGVDGFRMRPSRSRLLVRRAAAVFVSVTLGGAALAAGMTWLRIEAVEGELEARFAELHASGLLEEPLVHESADVRAAREDLARVLEGVKQDDLLMPAFGAPGVLEQTDTTEEIERLEAGLRERALWLTTLQDLPEELWRAERETPAPEGLDRPEDYTRRPSDGLSELRAVTNLIAAKAFVVGQDPDLAREAGQWLGRGLALLRATDSGSMIDIMIRVPMEQILLMCADTLCEIDGQDVKAIREAMRAEFLRHPELDRLARSLRSDLRWQERVFYDNRTKSPIPGLEGRAAAQLACAALVNEWRALLDSDLELELARLAAAAKDPNLPILHRMHYIPFEIWKLRLDRRDAFLALR